MRFRQRALLVAVLLLPGGMICAGTEEGVASYYADSLDGNPTASGEPYDKAAMTAAHRTLPFGTEVRVINLTNQREVTVRINDRGPHAESRIIDVSGAAAKQLGLVDSGTAKVRLQYED